MSSVATSPPARKPTNRRAKLAWLLPLAGHVCVISGVFWALSRPNLFVIVPLVLLGAALLLVGVIAIVFSFFRAPKHAWLGLASLLFAGPLLFFILLFACFPQAREEIAQTWRSMQRKRAIAREVIGEALEYEELELPKLAIPKPFVTAQADDVWVRISCSMCRET
jgi:hypothetical protein